MESGTGVRFDDPGELDVSPTGLAPPSEHEMERQQPGQKASSSRASFTQNEENARAQGQEVGISTPPKQSARRSPLSGSGVPGISGPRATLYALAFRACGSAHDIRARPLGHHQQQEEGWMSPRPSRAGTPARSNRRPRPVVALTRDMCATYASGNPLFRFTPNVPRRVLTVPSTGAGNDGLDNVEYNLIARVNDILDAPRTKYSVLDLLGQGTFGQVFRCQDHSTKDIVAIKVVKNKPAYRNQALLEIQVAKLLNERYDPHDTKNIVRLLDFFQFQNHLCLVFELLSINLFELLKQNQFRGLPLPLIRHFITQILEALEALEQANVIHCDLKPENVLLMNKAPDGDEMARAARRRGAFRGGGSSGHQPGANRLKVIDFGSACFEGQTMYSYIQSRFYRSPEVLLGLPYDGAIDIWSLGCITVEMFLGLPIFPGVSDHNQICRIVEMTGSLPEFMLENGKDTLKFFKRVKFAASEGGGGGIGGGGGGGVESAPRGWRAGADMAVSPDRDLVDAAGRERGSRRGRTRGYSHVLKTPEEYARDTGTAVPQLKKYFKHSNIPDIVQSYPLPGATHRRTAAGGSTPDAAQEKEARRVFTHFVLGLLNPNPWKRWTPKQAASHPFITGQPHPRDLGALTIPDDPLMSGRRSRQRQAMQLQHQKDQQEAERKHSQWLRQQQRQQQEQQQREHRRGMKIPGASSQPRGMSTLSGRSLVGSTTPGSMGSHTPSYLASPLQQHIRRGSGDSGLMAMQIAHTPQAPRVGASERGFSSMSHPIDVPAGEHSSTTGGSGGRGGMGIQGLFGRDLDGSNVAGGRQQDLMARSMGYPARGGAGTSYPPLTGDEADLDLGGGEAYSYSAASFSMGGASGNYVASDFGYALQRPGLRYEPASYKQSPPTAYSSSHTGPSSTHLGRRRGSDVAPGIHPGSFSQYQQYQGEGLRGHERGGRALSMDHTQGGGGPYYMGGSGAGLVGGRLPGGGGRFGPQSLHYPSSMQQASSSVSAATGGPPGYTPLARGGFIAPPAGFRTDVPQASIPWVRAGRSTGSSQPQAGGARAHSTSPLFGRPLAVDFPSGDPQDLDPDLIPDDLHARDSGFVGAGGGGAGAGGGPDSWSNRLSGVESDEHAGRLRQRRQNAQRVHRHEHRQDPRRGLATDPDLAGDVSSFSFQLDDGRLPGGGGGTAGGVRGSSSLSSPLDWMESGGRGAGVLDDPEGVLKRSLNGTSKGVSPATAGTAAAIAGPREDGELIRRVACDDASSVVQQQPSQQAGSLLSQQLMQYQHQQQRQGEGQQRSRTPFGSSVHGASNDGTTSPVPSYGIPGGAGGSGGRSSAEQRWASSRGGGAAGTGVHHMDETLPEHGVDMGSGSSSWMTSSSTRALRRRGSSGSSEFYFVDTLQQQGGATGSYAQPPMSPAAATSSNRPLYPSRNHAAGGTPSSFGSGVPHHGQGKLQGNQSPMPPRPPRAGDMAGTGLEKASWSESNWGPRTSPSPSMQQRLPTPPRSMGTRGGSSAGGSGSGGWDERGNPAGPDIMRSIHEGGPSPNN